LSGEIQNSLLLTGLLAAALISFLLVCLALILARRHSIVDRPGDRQSHTRPTPTGGGLGIIVALAIASLAFSHFHGMDYRWLMVIIPGALLLSVVGWLDDRQPLSNRIRLFVQLVVSIGLLAFTQIAIPPVNWWLAGVGGIAVMWVMNSYNFMDGSHGMAGFQGLFCGLTLVLLFMLGDAPDLALPALLLAGCCAGFLPVNFPRPSIFMGDAGSVPLGFLIAALMVLGMERGVLNLPLCLLVLAVFLVDSSLTLLNRVIRGEQWYTAHKQHMYQRLIAQGWPHSRVLLLYQAINLVVVAPAVMLALMYPENAWVVTGALFLLMTTGWYAASLRLGVRQ
jgi:Fuc2NAc and GlcNAc transferase